MNDFEKCIKRSSRNGRHKIDCVLGLWGVEAPTKNRAENEALGYWVRYVRDGEYYKIIGGESPTDIFRRYVKEIKNAHTR